MPESSAKRIEPEGDKLVEHFRVKVGRGGRLTLPQELCEQMGWRIGDKVNIAALPDNTGIQVWSDAQPHKVAIFKKPQIQTA